MNRLLFIILIFTIFKAEAQTPSALAIGDSLYALGDYSKAITAYLKSKETDKVQLKLAKSYEASGNISNALAFYKEYISKNPGATIAKYNYGQLLIDGHRFKEADSIFVKLMGENPKNANFPYQLGVIAEKLKDSTSIAKFAYAYYIDDEHENSIYKLARNAVEERQFVSAAKYIEKGLALNSNSTRFLTLDALQRFHTKDYHGSIKSWEKLLALYQENEQILKLLGLCYFNTNQFEKAIDLYAKLINEYDNTNPTYHKTIAKFFSFKSEYEKAEDHLNISILLQRKPLDEEYTSLAAIYGKQNKHKAEMDALKKAIAEYPENEAPYYRLAIAADNYFKSDIDALPYYEKYIEKFGESGKFRELAKARLIDLKKNIFLGKN